VHQAAPTLAELAAAEWDRDNAHFPPTTLQTSDILTSPGTASDYVDAADIDRLAAIYRRVMENLLL
jgi:hypothetical protein